MRLAKTNNRVADSVKTRKQEADLGKSRTWDKHRPVVDLVRNQEWETRQEDSTRLVRRRTRNPLALTKPKPSNPAARLERSVATILPPTTSKSRIKGVNGLPIVNVYKSDS